MWTPLPEVASGVYLGGIPSILQVLIRSAEFSSRLEGYENVRAYCYNCKLVRSRDLECFVAFSMFMSAD